jgi:hypothetical protein
MAISSDGRFVAFVSEASDLVANDTKFARDVFVRDTQLEVTSFVSVNTSGAAPGSGTSGRIAMTPDGRFVTFIRGSDNLVENDTNLKQDVLVRGFTVELDLVNQCQHHWYCRGYRER